MDIIFNCPECEQELSVDSSGAGTEISCPTCDAKIVVPPSPPGAVAAPPPEAVHDAAHPINPIAASAAAKVEMHLKVPMHAEPSASLIEKPLPPLEVAAKEVDKKVRIKTIRRIDCVEVGHDRFDDAVTTFLGKVGESNIISINTLAYTHIDIGSQKLLTDYGVLIVYRG